MKRKDEHGFKIGESVIVKAGVKDPDSDNDLGGWQGRVIAVEDDMVDLAWDSLTLKAMPSSMIEWCEEENLDWAEMRLRLDDVERAKARDVKSDVAEVKHTLASKYVWIGLGEEGRRIQKVLAEVEADNMPEALVAWSNYLETTLTFPFEAVVAESQERGPLHSGDKVKVTSINDIDDELRGLIADLRVGQRKYNFPLCDLEVADQASANYQPVKDYVVWFANR